MASKYSEIFTGRKNLWFLLKYEFITMFISGMPGAIGYLLRKVFYPRIFKEVGRGCVFGRNITIRHPHKIRIGAHSFIDDGAVLDAKGAANDGIRIGENAFVGRNVILSCKEGSIFLDDFCNISSNCTLFSEPRFGLGNTVSSPGTAISSPAGITASWTCPRPSCSSRLCPRAGSG